MRVADEEVHRARTRVVHNAKRKPLATCGRRGPTGAGRLVSAGAVARGTRSRCRASDPGRAGADPSTPSGGSMTALARACFAPSPRPVTGNWGVTRERRLRRSRTASTATRAVELRLWVVPVGLSRGRAGRDSYRLPSSRRARSGSSSGRRASTALVRPLCLSRPSRLCRATSGSLARRCARSRGRRTRHLASRFPRRWRRRAPPRAPAPPRARTGRRRG